MGHNATETVYIFDCPVHGLREGVLCFRAFIDENKDRWKKYEIERKELQFEDGELEAFLERRLLYA